jgi:hypothetical protein
MLRQLHLLTIPTAISIAFFDATFFIIARTFGFSGREIVLGVIAGAVGGIYVLVAVLWRGWGRSPVRVTDQVAELPPAPGNDQVKAANGPPACVTSLRTSARVV